MTSREAPTPADRRPGDEPGQRPRRAPLRETAAGELDGLYRFAVSRLGGRSHMASDVVQQALAVALAHAEPPETDEVQRAWLRGIVRNVIRHDLRSLRRRRAALQRAAALHDPDPSQRQPIDTRADESRARAVQALFLAVAELDTADQDLFYAFYRSGRSHACIARELGTTVKAVEARLYRMRARLRAADTFPASAP